MKGFVEQYEKFLVEEKNTPVEVKAVAEGK